MGSSSCNTFCHTGVCSKVRYVWECGCEVEAEKCGHGRILATGTTRGSFVCTVPHTDDVSRSSGHLPGDTFLVTRVWREWVPDYSRGDRRERKDSGRVGHWVEKPEFGFQRKADAAGP